MFLGQIKALSTALPLRSKALLQIDEWQKISKKPHELVSDVCNHFHKLSDILKVADVARKVIERGDLDAEFVKSKGMATAGMLVFKQKILQGSSEIEKSMKKKRIRMEAERVKMESKIQTLAPELIVCFSSFFGLFNDFLE
jgi:hypothetical protein